jgi:hypothetical protein
MLIHCNILVPFLEVKLKVKSDILTIICVHLCADNINLTCPCLPSCITSYASKSVAVSPHPTTQH